MCLWILIVSSQAFEYIKARVIDEVSVTLLSNPATNNLGINTTGFQNNKQTIISMISASGFVIKQIQTSGLARAISLDISSLASWSIYF